METTDAAVLGVDLAWGPRARTGLAVLGADGALMASATVRTDEEIAQFVAGWRERLAVVAVDAPLIVRNASGRRPCEAQVAADFARFHAGPYPSNTSLPHFDPPRAATLAARLGWVPDPAVAPRPGRPVCLEVFPHPATVSLFGLERVLPYKARAGRSLAVRRDAAALLVGLVEDRLGPTLRPGASPRWRELRAAVESAARPVDLRRVEDEIDAVVCGYVAWRWLRTPEQLRVYGDAGSGFIVTFPPPG
ncbi:MAG: DUF429 domain-containing protein [Kineosporiaceae bacterium]